MDRCEGEYLYAKRRQIFHGLRWETGIRIRITCFKRVLTFLLASLVLFTIAQWFCYAPPDMTPREAHMWMTISRRRGRKLLSVERDEKGRIIAEDKVDFWNLRTSPQQHNGASLFTLSPKNWSNLLLTTQQKAQTTIYWKTSSSKKVVDKEWETRKFFFKLN